MSKIYALFILLVLAGLCLEWTRLTGTIKSVNLRDSTVTILNRDGDLLTVPVDYQVIITDKHGEILGLRQLVLNQKVTILRTLMEKPKEEPSDMPVPDASFRGHK